MLEQVPDKMAVNLQYQLIKLAWSQYQSAPESLSADLFTKLEQQAKAAQKMMVAVLASQEAKGEQVKQQEVQFLLEQLQQQFDNKESYELSLKQQGLTEASLQEAIYQDLICEKTLEAQSKHYSKVSEEEALLYYQKNRSRFVQPERRKVSHILVTINEQFVENERQQALAKIEKLRHRLQFHIKDFENLALQHSECPTALNKGFIGEVVQGQLYPELDAALFNMTTDCISSVIETEIGFHLLLCHAIFPAGEMEMQAALKEICSQLNLHRQKKYQKKWLNSLLS
jgi:nitrogen fixation protein NifM